MIDVNAPPKTNDPVGTLDELEACGLAGDRYASCSRPTADNRGCPYLGKKTTAPCEFAFKGLPVDQGGGPRNKGVLLISDNGSANQFVVPCFHFMALVNGHRGSGETYEVIADEGEMIKTKGTVEVIETGADGKKRVIVNEVLIETKVEPFKRPHENPLLVEEMGTRQILKSVADRQKARRMAAAVGFGANEFVNEKLDMEPVVVPQKTSPLDDVLKKAHEDKVHKK